VIDQLQLQDDFDYSGLFGGSQNGCEDLNDILINRQDFTATRPVLEMFDTIYAVPFGGDTGTAFMVDVAFQQIWMMRGGQMKLIAGQYGFSGLRTGPGEQAILGIGGFQDAYGMAVDSHGNLYVTNNKTGHILKLTEQPSGSWDVSIYASGMSANALSMDGADNLWTISGSNLIKILPNNAGVQPFPTGILNINVIAALKNGHVLILTRNNGYDPLYDFDPVTEKVARLCGMNDAEVAAYEAAHGGVHLVDGPALNGATLHSPQFAWWNDDGSEVWFGGGDLRQLRRYRKAEALVDSLYPDGLWKEAQVSIGADTGGNPSLPLYLISPGGQQANGYPWDFGRPGGNTAVLKVLMATVPDPIPGPGGTVNYGYLNGIDTNGVLGGWGINGSTLTQNATVDIQVDGQPAASVVTTSPCQECLDLYKTTTGQIATVQPGFAWTIPAQWRDGKPHVVTASIAGTALMDPSNGASARITFTLQPQSQGGTMGQVSGTITLGNVTVAATDTPYMLLELLDGNGVLVAGVAAQHAAPGTTAVSFSNVPAPGSYKIRLTNMTGANVPIGAAMLSNLVNLAAGTVTVQLGVSINATGS